MLLPFAGNAVVFQCFMDTAIDFCKLFGSKNGAAWNEAGAGGEVTFGGSVTVCASTGAIIVSRVQAAAIRHPRIAIGNPPLLLSS